MGLERKAVLRAAPARTVHYERRRPEETVLHCLVREHLQTFLAQVQAKNATGLPEFVKTCSRLFSNAAFWRTDNTSVPADEHAHDAPACMGWARLLKRVFDLDLEHCPQCGGEFKIIAAIEEPAVIVRILRILRILTHLGLPARAPPRSPARPLALLGGLILKARPALQRRR